LSTIIFAEPQLWTIIVGCHEQATARLLPTKRKRLNRRIVADNLAEALQELERLHRLAATGKLNEAQLQVGLCHAYHHLNFAWNIRFVPTSQYAAFTTRQFKQWGRYPPKIEDL
jgi:hypothetical protein